MDLEPCFKVHNWVVIQLNNTKLGRMTNFVVLIHMMVLFYKFDIIGNLTTDLAKTGFCLFIFPIVCDQTATGDELKKENVDQQIENYGFGHTVT